MYLYKLKTLKIEMTKNHQIAAGMKFEYNNTIFDVIFFNLEDMLLLFKKPNSNLFFLIQISKDFSINIHLEKDDYKKLAKLVPKVRDKKFNSYDFFLNFSKTIPVYEKVSQVEIKDNVEFISNYIDDIKSTKFVGFHRHINDGKRVTAQNLNKTALYLGRDEMFRCKKDNISSVWKK